MCKLRVPNALKSKTAISKSAGIGKEVGYSFNTQTGKVYDFIAGI
jgi:alpha-L-fucosidase 2